MRSAAAIISAGRWTMLAALWLLGEPVSSAEPAVVEARALPDVSMVGVNLAGGEFGKLPGVANRDYACPGPQQFDYCQAKGLTLIRFPLKWERLQPKLKDALDEAKLKRLDASVKLASQRGLKILLDVHNYARYQDQLIGTTAVPNEAFATTGTKQRFLAWGS